MTAAGRAPRPWRATLPDGQANHDAKDGGNRMRDMDRYFIGLGIAAGMIGMLLGIGMGIKQDFTLSPVHAHLNLVGWVSLVLFGLCYRAGVARQDGWAAVHFWVATAGVVLFPIGIFISVTRDQPAVAIIGALLTFASILLFGVNFLRARGA